MVLGIYGAGGLGREVLDLACLINKQENRWEQIIFIADSAKEEKVNGIFVYSFDEALITFKHNIEIIIGVGEPATREKLFNRIKEKGVSLPVLIHPGVSVPSTTIVGEGSVIQCGCFVSCNARIGENVYVQPHVNIGHDDIILDGAVISGMANLAGHVSIGEYTYVGLSAAIKEGVKVGSNSIIGMYSAVYKDVDDGVVAMGNPARVMKNNEDRRVF